MTDKPDMPRYFEDAWIEVTWGSPLRIAYFVRFPRGQIYRNKSFFGRFMHMQYSRDGDLTFSSRPVTR